MEPRERSEGINEFIQDEDVSAVDLTAVSLILESLTETIEDPVVCYTQYNFS